MWSMPGKKQKQAKAPAAEPALSLSDPALYVNRELSLLAFQRRVLEEHFDLALRVNAPLRRPELLTGKAMRKFGIRFSEHHPRGEEVRRRMVAITGADDWARVLDEFYPA